MTAATTNGKHLAIRVKISKSASLSLLHLLKQFLPRPSAFQQCSAFPSHLTDVIASFGVFHPCLCSRTLFAGRQAIQRNSEYFIGVLLSIYFDSHFTILQFVWWMALKKQSCFCGLTKWIWNVKLLNKVPEHMNHKNHAEEEQVPKVGAKSSTSASLHLAFIRAIAGS